MGKLQQKKKKIKSERERERERKKIDKMKSEIHPISLT